MSREPGYPERRAQEGRRSGREQEHGAGEASFADVFDAIGGGGRPRPARSRDDERGDASADRYHGDRARAAEPPRPQQRDPEDFDDDDEAPAASIRSYAWTGGRTKSNVEYSFELETLISTGNSYRPGMPLRQEYQSVVQLCSQPRSVAEVGALLNVPFGVTKVLLADMAEQGLVDVHQAGSESGSEPHLMLMERVLSGLRRL